MVAKRSKGFVSNLLWVLIRPLEGSAWILTASALFLASLGWGTHFLWRQYGDQVLAQAQYHLDVDKMEVTPQPDWIRQSDVKQFAVVRGQLQGASLHDRDLPHRVAQAFLSNPWVRSVKYVNKRHPSGIRVELEYRQPVAMVVVPPGTHPGQTQEGLWPVDVDGVFLPVEIEAVDAIPYPKISAVDTSPAGPPGTPWGDPRVTAAAQIIAAIGDLWSELKVYSVQVPLRHGIPAAGTSDNYALLTRGGKLIAWGSPPGKEHRGERVATEKIRVLAELHKRYGSLDVGQSGPRADTNLEQEFQFDLRQALNSNGKVTQ